MQVTALLQEAVMSKDKLVYVLILRFTDNAESYEILIIDHGLSLPLQ